MCKKKKLRLNKEDLRMNTLLEIREHNKRTERYSCNYDISQIPKELVDSQRKFFKKFIKPQSQKIISKHLDDK